MSQDARMRERHELLWMVALIIVLTSLPRSELAGQDERGRPKHRG